MVRQRKKGKQKTVKRKALSAQRIRKGARGLARPAPIHPVVTQADPTAAQLLRSEYEPAMAPNPLGEVTLGGEILRHVVCRRVPWFETLHRRGSLSRKTFVMLEWYEGRRALAGSGLTRCALDMSGGGHGPSDGLLKTRGEAVRDAASDLAWARSFVPAVLLPLFDAVMEDEAPFTECAARFWPRLKATAGRLRCAREFRAAADAMAAGVGTRLVRG